MIFSILDFADVDFQDLGLCRAHIYVPDLLDTKSGFKITVFIYEDGYFETQSCDGKTRFVSLYIKYDCYALRRAFLNRSKVLKSLRLKLFIYHLILVSLVLEHSIYSTDRTALNG